MTDATRRPHTVQEAVQFLLEDIPKEYLQHIAAAPEENLAEYHLTLGMQIRNGYGLWGENQELLSSIGYGLDADDASAVIIRALWEELQRRQIRH